MFFDESLYINPPISMFSIALEDIDSVCVCWRYNSLSISYESVLDTWPSRLQNSISYELFKIFLISFLTCRIFKFFMLNDQEINKLIILTMFFVIQYDFIGGWSLSPTIQCSR